MFISCYLCSCSQLPPEVKNRDINVAVYGAEAELIKIFCNGVLVLDRRIPNANEYGISLTFNLPRTTKKMQLIIERRRTKYTFVVDPQHFGDIGIYFDIYGGVSIEDDSKRPPMG